MTDMQLARRVITSRCHEGNKARLDSYVGADNWPALAACIGRAVEKRTAPPTAIWRAPGGHGDEHGGLPSLA
jgi:hypothetical protein